jgi:hypothetical protein
VSGRHRSYSAQQPSRNNRNGNRGGGGSTFPTGLVALGAVVVLAAGGAYVVYSKKTNDTTGSTGGATAAGCNGPSTTLNVGASPDIQDTIQKIADAAGGCVHVVVNADESSVVASFLNGTGKAGDITSQPDVWIPDSSMWIDVARSTPSGAGEVPATGTPVATSPVVLGMPKPIAPAAAFGWADLLASQQSAKPIQVAVPDPTASGPGLAAITMVRGVVTASAGGDAVKANQEITGIYRIMAANTKGSLNNLLAALPTSEATSADSSGIQAFPSTEQKIIAYNGAKPTVPLTAVYPKEGTTMMDYPYVEGTHLDADHKKAADQFLQELQTGAAASALANVGFRDAHGTAAGAISPANGVNPAVPQLFPADTTHQAAPGALKVWATVSEQTRGLIVLDISGSMGLPVPGQVDPATGTTLSRLQITAEACIGGLPLFGDTSELGLWTFTTSKTTGKTIHNQVVPLGPLNAPVDGVTRRAALNADLGHLSIQSGSRNGLYDTILDAYQNVLQGWSENKSNAVVVFTDGKDDGLNSMSADALIGKINALKAANPNHPVRVIVVALGKGVDLTTLTKITAAADGKALYAATPDQIGAAVLEGFASRLGT